MAKEKTSFELSFVFCGREDCAPLHSWGPGIRPVYVLHCISKGRGIVQSQDASFSLGEGEGFLIRPGETFFYRADQEDPWSYCWIGFEGTQVESLLTEIGLGQCVFRCGQMAQVEQIIDQMLHCRNYSAKNELLLKSLLYRFFSVLVPETLMHDGGVMQEMTVQSTYVEQAETFFRRNFYRRISVSDAASYVGINRSYLYTLFRQLKGISPSNYLSDVRLKQAAEMLGIAGYTIENVAYSCGYQELSVFVRAFKRRYGMTPLQFRQKELSQQRRLKDSLLVH